MNEPRNDRSPEMSDEQLQQLLRRLPRESAGAELKAGVMARLAARSAADAGPAAPARLLAFRPEGRRLPAWSPWLLAAAALLLLGLGLREWQHRRDLDESMRRIAELRGQYEELAGELAELRREAAKAQPVVYVGGTEEVDLVLDLGRLAQARKDPQSVDPEARKKAREELERLYRESQGGPLY